MNGFITYCRTMWAVAWPVDGERWKGESILIFHRSVGLWMILYSLATQRSLLLPIVVYATITIALWKMWGKRYPFVIGAGLQFLVGVLDIWSVL